MVIQSRYPPWLGPKSEEGLKLRAIRLRAGVPMKDIAKAVGFSVCYISDIERGCKRCPKHVQKVYQQLEVRG